MSGVERTHAQLRSSFSVEATPHPDWAVIVPVKRAERAKSRLAAPYGVRHDLLARAIAQDTLTAVTATPGVVLILVSDDPELGTGWSGPGRYVVADPGGGLNAAVLAGLDAVPRSLERVAILLGDLPALRAADLASALAACAAVLPAFVPDHRQTGTVLLAGTRVGPGRPQPRFGPGSATGHARAGAQRMDLDLPSLRVDVDDSDGLRAALALGCGPHTRRLVEHAGLS